MHIGDMLCGILYNFLTAWGIRHSKVSYITLSLTRSVYTGISYIAICTLLTNCMVQAARKLHELAAGGERYR